MSESELAAIVRVRNGILARLLAVMGTILLIPDLAATARLLFIEIRAVEPSLPLPVLSWTTALAALAYGAAAVFHVASRKKNPGAMG